MSPNPEILPKLTDILKKTLPKDKERVDIILEKYQSYLTLQESVAQTLTEDEALMYQEADKYIEETMEKLKETKLAKERLLLVNELDIYLDLLATGMILPPPNPEGKTEEEELPPTEHDVIDLPLSRRRESPALFGSLPEKPRQRLEALIDGLSEEEQREVLQALLSVETEAQKKIKLQLDYLFLVKSVIEGLARQTSADGDMKRYVAFQKGLAAIDTSGQQDILAGKTFAEFSRTSAAFKEMLLVLSGYDDLHGFFVGGERPTGSVDEPIETTDSLPPTSFVDIQSQEQLDNLYFGAIACLGRQGQFEGAAHLAEGYLEDEFSKGREMFREKERTDYIGLKEEAGKTIDRDVRDYKYGWYQDILKKLVEAKEKEIGGSIRGGAEWVYRGGKWILEGNPAEMQLNRELFAECEFEAHKRVDTYVQDLKDIEFQRQANKYVAEHYLEEEGGVSIPSSKAKRQIWEQYKKMFNAKDSLAPWNWSDEAWHDIKQEFITQAPFILACGIGGMAFRGVLSLAARALIGSSRTAQLIGFTVKEGLIAGKTIATGWKARALLFLGKHGLGTLADATGFEVAAAGLQGEWLFDLPDKFERILWSYLGFLSFKGIGSYAGEKLIMSSGLKKFLSETIGKANPNLQKVIEWAAIKGHTQVMALLIVEGLHYYHVDRADEFFKEFGREILHAYVAIGALELEGGALRIVGGGILKRLGPEGPSTRLKGTKRSDKGTREDVDAPELSQSALPDRVQRAIDKGQTSVKSSTELIVTIGILESEGFTKITRSKDGAEVERPSDGKKIRIKAKLPENFWGDYEAAKDGLAIARDKVAQLKKLAVENPSVFDALVGQLDAIDITLDQLGEIIKIQRERGIKPNRETVALLVLKCRDLSSLATEGNFETAAKKIAEAYTHNPALRRFYAGIYRNILDTMRHKDPKLAALALLFLPGCSWDILGIPLLGFGTKLPPVIALIYWFRPGLLLIPNKETRQTARRRYLGWLGGSLRRRRTHGAAHDAEAFGRDRRDAHGGTVESPLTFRIRTLFEIIPQDINMEIPEPAEFVEVYLNSIHGLEGAHASAREITNFRQTVERKLGQYQTQWGRSLQRQIDAVVRADRDYREAQNAGNAEILRQARKDLEGAIDKLQKVFDSKAEKLHDLLEKESEHHGEEQVSIPTTIAYAAADVVALSMLLSPLIFLVKLFKGVATADGILDECTPNPFTSKCKESLKRLFEIAAKEKTPVPSSYDDVDGDWFHEDGKEDVEYSYNYPDGEDPQAGHFVRKKQPDDSWKVYKIEKTTIDKEKLEPVFVGIDRGDGLEEVSWSSVPENYESVKEWFMLKGEEENDWEYSSPMLQSSVVGHFVRKKQPDDSYKVYQIQKTGGAKKAVLVGIDKGNGLESIVKPKDPRAKPAPKVPGKTPVTPKTSAGAEILDQIPPAPTQ